MFKFILLAFIAAAACGTPKTTSDESSANTTETSIEKENGTITLAVGERKKVGELQIQFKEVLEDSRCPTGTTCIWQGRAKLLVETSQAGMDVVQSEIIFGKLQNGEIENHTFYKSGKTTITATGINPYPSKDSGTTNLAYQLTLEVSN
ncbi:hypothetical protein [Rasiella sp. SM2506]|uniref:hypothetical protein n=1 Tax=Rasiella sp. SM2506 TaxID=3423914 RepID=UPI003D7B567D